jgi:ribosomal protein L31E
MLSRNKTLSSHLISCSLISITYLNNLPPEKNWSDLILLATTNYRRCILNFKSEHYIWSRLISKPPNKKQVHNSYVLSYRDNVPKKVILLATTNYRRCILNFKSEHYIWSRLISKPPNKKQVHNSYVLSSRDNVPKKVVERRSVAYNT